MCARSKRITNREATDMTDHQTVLTIHRATMDRSGLPPDATEADVHDALGLSHEVVVIILEDDEAPGDGD